MTVLVTYASKHGATQGIAERIAQTLRQRGREADVAPVDIAESISAFDAVIVGSAVYYGSWMKEAVRFVRLNHAALAARPVWFFSSGPLGAEVNDSEQQPREVSELEALVGARGHRMFFGALNLHTLSFPERMVVKAVHGAEGDFRDWNAIESWAAEIAQALEREAARSPSTSLG